MLWYGDVANVPSGWHHCDGTVGTPDLRGKFIISVRGDAAAPIPGQIGGSINHDHNFAGDGHAHQLPVGTEIDDVTPIGNFASLTGSVPAVGTTDAQSHYPTYHALVFIMKL